MLWLKIAVYLLNCIQSVYLLFIAGYCLAIYCSGNQRKAKRAFLKLSSVYIFIAILTWLPGYKDISQSIWHWPLELMAAVLTATMISVGIMIYNQVGGNKLAKMPPILVAEIFVAAFFLPLTINLPLIFLLVRGDWYSIFFLWPIAICLPLLFMIKRKKTSIILYGAFIFYFIGAFVGWRFTSRPEQLDQSTALFKYSKPAGWTALATPTDSTSSVKFNMIYSGFGEINRLMSGCIEPSLFVIISENEKKYTQFKQYVGNLTNKLDGCQQDIVTVDGLRFISLSCSGYQSIPSFEATASKIRINNHFMFNDDKLMYIVYYGIDSNIKDFEFFLDSIQWLNEN